MKSSHCILVTALAALTALSGCVQPGGEGPRSTYIPDTYSLSDRRDALRTVRVVEKAPAGSTSLGQIGARRCHRNFLEDTPTETALSHDLKLAAYAQGGDAIRITGMEKISGLMANCWYVLEGKAEVYRLGK